MRVLIREVKSNELVSGIIREGKKDELPTLMDEWEFDFLKKAKERGKQVYILVKEESQNVIEGCMVFSIHETLGPYLDLLEVAPHNKNSSGKYKRVSGCLIAFACGLSLAQGETLDKGFLSFRAIGREFESAEILEEYYRERYGAIKNFHGFMEIHPEKSKQLIKEYLEKEEE